MIKVFGPGMRARIHLPHPEREAARLSSFALKFIALTCMCIDHMGLALFPSVSAFRCVGRLAFPLYCFLLSQGYAHTRDIRAYARRLLLLAFLSEIPFDLLIFGRVASGVEQNVVFSLLLGLLALYAADSLRGRRLACILALTALCAAAMILRVSYGWLGVALCLGFHFAREHRFKQALCSALLCGLYALSLLLSGVERSWALLSLYATGASLLILLYNGKRGLHAPALTFLFYAAYPLHIAALVLARALRIVPPYFWG